ncbi:MAG: DUF6538 domain-containing protein [Aliihoeflea sp.]|uniref:DUF6538 domain-containing protein n=1 Tax=Aliihoeflea sp. TaxID=2608088 RepID=UPI004034DF89
MDVSREVSLDISSERPGMPIPPVKRTSGSRPGRYLVRSGSVYLFQIKVPDDLAGTPQRVLRIGLGALTAREARVQAESLAVLARGRFDLMRATKLKNDDAQTGGSPEFDPEFPLVAMGELKGYLQAMRSIIAQPASPTPPHQRHAFDGMRDLVMLNREIAKGAAGNALITDNADIIREKAIAKVQMTVDIANGVPLAVVAPSTSADKTSGIVPTPNDVGLPVTIHRDADGKIVPAFRLDRRAAPRKQSKLPLLSEAAEEYFAARALRSSPENKDIGTARYRLGVFLDLIGDHPVDTYTATDIQAYIALLTHWPAQEKDRPRDRSPREILAANANLTMKPLMRSALEDGYVTVAKTVIRSQMTAWNYPDPFAGARFQYPETAGSARPTEPLSSSQLTRIFHTGVERDLLDEAMLPLLGHLTARRLGLLVHLKGCDFREKYPGVWVAQTSGIVLSESGVWKRVPIKTDASTTFFVLHDLLREIGFVDWAMRQGDQFLFRELTRLKDPSKSASSYMQRLFKRSGVEGDRREVFHSLRGGNIEQMRDNKIDPRDRKLQAGHKLDDEHDLYGFRAISEKRARELAHAPLMEDVDFSMFKRLNFSSLSTSKRTMGRRPKAQGR